MGGKRVYREYNEDGQLIKMECGKCHKIKDINCFIHNESKKDGVVTTCKECSVNYYQNNKEKIAEHRANYYQSNKEKIANYQANYYQSNKEKIIKCVTNYRQSNKEKIANYQANYHQSNKEKIAKYKANYYQNNKEKIAEQKANHYQSKCNEAIQQIYENVTKKLYPQGDVQYGIIYRVHCIPTNRYYVGQTQYSFDIRYRNKFFKNKTRYLDDNNIKKQLLEDDIKKFGEESFEIVKVLDVAFSRRELNEKEAYYIDYYNSYEEGYNSNRGVLFMEYDEEIMSEQN